MVKKEEYELLPHKEIESLKKELAQLRDNKGISKSLEVHSDIKNLQRSINKLLNVFDNATELIKEDIHRDEAGFEEKVLKELDGFSKQIKRNTEENALIAKVLLKFNDSVTDLEGMFVDFKKSIKSLKGLTIPEKELKKEQKKQTIDRTIILKQFKDEFK
jgi:hypothetical protein